MENNPVNNIRKIIEFELRRNGIENFKFESRIICEFLKKESSEFIQEQSSEFLQSALQIVERRKNKEPLQYIIGEWEFYGDIYKLNEHCLIPRPETEFLTETMINSSYCYENEKIIDLCCGSGCIAISALKRRKDLTCISIDISSDAISMAKENAKLNGVHDRMEFYTKDILNQTDEVQKIISDSNCTFLVSNPPYLSQKDMEVVRYEKEEVSHEPEIALYGGKDGYDFYRHIIKFYANNKNIQRIAFEVGLNQFSIVEELLKQQNFKTKIIYDYSKIERIIYGCLQN